MTCKLWWWIGIFAACTDGTKFKSIRGCNKYYECKNGKFTFNVQDCPDQFSVDSDSGTCVPDENCPPKPVKLGT